MSAWHACTEPIRQAHSAFCEASRHCPALYARLGEISLLYWLGTAFEVLLARRAFPLCSLGHRLVQMIDLKLLSELEPAKSAIGHHALQVNAAHLHPAATLHR